MLRTGEDVKVHYLQILSRFLIQKEFLINKSAPSSQHYSEWQERKAELHRAAKFPACCCHSIIYSLWNASSRSSWPTATSTHLTSPREMQQTELSGTPGNISITIVLVFHSSVFLSCKMEVSVKYSSTSHIYGVVFLRAKVIWSHGGQKKRNLHILPEHLDMWGQASPNRTPHEKVHYDQFTQQLQIYY